MRNEKIELVKRTGTGLAFVVFPIVFIFAFAIHPNLFSFAIVTEVSARVSEFHGNRLMHLGHALMLLTVSLLIVVSLKFMDMLPERGARLGFMIQGIGLYQGRAISRWQSVSLIVAMVLLGVSAAVDIDLFGLVASVILTIAMLPIGVQLIAGSNRQPSEKH
ncbi:MAG: hypothetical protein WBN15_07565 [Polyangiales bacterium]|jgi:hypothetical protein